jgi:hypothetical protein
LRFSHVVVATKPGPSKAGGGGYSVGEVYEPLSNVNPTGSGSNCVACGQAGRATANGSPASALPIQATDVAALGRPTAISPSSSNVALRLSAPGSNGLVQVPSTGGHPSHLLNVVNDGGRIIYVDTATWRVNCSDATRDLPVLGLK